MSSLTQLWNKIKYWLWQIAHEWLYDLAWFVGPVTMWLVSDFKIEGPGRLPKTGGVMFTSNHLSQWDLISIHNILPRSFYTMAKVEFFEVFFAGGMVRLLGAFPVSRGKADRQSINRAIELLKQGKLLGIFPEGHRSDTYALMKAHNGAALIAVQAQATLVPVAITGTELISRSKSWKEGKSFRQRRPRVVIRVGEPYKLPEVEAGQKVDLDETTDFIMSKIAELLPPEYQGEYSPEKLAERQAERQQLKRERASRKAVRQQNQKASPVQEVNS